MDFEQEKVEDFLSLFESVKDKIVAFPGCKHVELCRDSKIDHVFYTFSEWDSEEHLEDYRHSELFEDTWAKTKVYFSGKPLAYSLIKT